MRSIMASVDVLTMIYLLAIAILVYLTVFVTYRIFLHPLSRFPAPWMNKISPAPAIICLLKGQMGMDVKTLHDHYGTSRFYAGETMVES
jgi:hypothetical protein